MCGNSQLLGGTPERDADVRGLNFTRLSLSLTSLWVCWDSEERLLIQPRSSKWLLWGQFLSISVWHLGKVNGRIDWSVHWMWSRYSCKQTEVMSYVAGPSSLTCTAAWNDGLCAEPMERVGRGNILTATSLGTPVQLPANGNTNWDWAPEWDSKNTSCCWRVHNVWIRWRMATEDDRKEGKSTATHHCTHLMWPLLLTHNLGRQVGPEKEKLRLQILHMDKEDWKTDLRENLVLRC